MINFAEHHIKQYQNVGLTQAGSFDDMRTFILGVQAPVGTILYFNGDRGQSITIGTSGIYQTELSNGFYISQIEYALPKSNQRIIVDTVQYGASNGEEVIS